MARLRKPITVAFCIGLCVSAIAPASAESRVYKGREAKALKCAAYFSYTSQVLESRGDMTPERALIANRIALHILEQHVGGTFAQKMQAYHIILDRLPKSELELLSESNEHLNRCTNRFLR